MRTILISIFAMILINLNAQDKKILFVCEHGTSKSMIAASYFNKLAIERHLPWRAESRGTDPANNIPDNVLRGLKSDGVQIASTEPKKVKQADIDKANKVILFYALSDDLNPDGKGTWWTNVPSVSDDYQKAREVIALQVEALIDSLTKH